MHCIAPTNDRSLRMAGAWEREAKRVITLADTLGVCLDGEALITGDVRDLMALRRWLTLRQQGADASHGNVLARHAGQFLA